MVGESVGVGKLGKISNQPRFNNDIKKLYSFEILRIVKMDLHMSQDTTS